MSTLTITGIAGFLGPLCKALVVGPFTTPLEFKQKRLGLTCCLHFHQHKFGQIISLDKCQVYCCLQRESLNLKRSLTQKPYHIIILGVDVSYQRHLNMTET